MLISGLLFKDAIIAKQRLIMKSFIMMQYVRLLLSKLISNGPNLKVNQILQTFNTSQLLKVFILDFVVLHQQVIGVSMIIHSPNFYNIIVFLVIGSLGSFGLS